MIAQALSGSNPGYVQVQLAPAAAVQAGAGWRLHGDATYGSVPGYTRIVSTNNATIEFKPLTGWNPPVAQTLQINAGTVNVITNLAYSVVPPMMLFDPVHGLAITGTTGTTYQIQYRTNLATGSWIPLQTNTIGSGTNTLLPWPPTNGPAAYYRTVWLP